MVRLGSLAGGPGQSGPLTGAFGPNPPFEVPPPGGTPAPIGPSQGLILPGSPAPQIPPGAAGPLTRSFGPNQPFYVPPALPPPSAPPPAGIGAPQLGPALYGPLSRPFGPNQPFDVPPPGATSVPMNPPAPPPQQYGLYPSIGFLTFQNGKWVFDNFVQSKTSNQLQATNPTAYAAIAASQTSTPGSSFYGTRGIGQVIQLPVSGNIAIGHYFNGQGYNSGLVSVWDANANLLATYQIPSCNRQDGATPIEMSPRELKADPTSLPGDERFMVNYDVFGSGGFGGPTPAHVLQEFSFNSGTKTITPVTVPFVAADGSWAPDSCWYGPDGTFYCAGSSTAGGLASLNAQNMAVWVKHAGSDRDFALQAPAVGAWPTNGSYATPVIPNYSLSTPVSWGIGFAGSLAQDPLTGSIIIPGLFDGFLGAVIPDQAAVVPDPTTSNPLNLIPGGGPGLPYGFDDISNLISAEDALFGTTSSNGDWQTIFASSTLAWTAAASCPVTPPNGSNALKMTATSNGLSSTQINSNGRWAVIANRTYAVFGWFLANTGTPGQSCGVQISWFNASGGLISNSSTFSVVDSTTAWSRAYGVATAPSGAVAATITANDQTTTTGQAHFGANYGMYDMTAPAGWSGFVTNIRRDGTSPRSGLWCLQLSAPFAQNNVAAITPNINVTPNREYFGSAYIRAATGVATGNCTLNIQFKDINGTVIAGTPGANYGAIDSTSGYTYLYVGTMAPANAVTADMVIDGATVNLGDTLYVDDVTFMQQPFRGVPKLDTGITQRRSDGSSISTGRPAIVGRTLYIPAGQTFTSTESTNYNNQMLAAPGYTPDTTHDQFLIAVQLNAFLGVGAGWLLIQQGKTAVTRSGSSVTPTLPVPSQKGTMLHCSVTNGTGGPVSLPPPWRLVLAVINNNVADAELWMYANNPGGIQSVVVSVSHAAGEIRATLAEYRHSIGPGVLVNALGSGINGQASSVIATTNTHASAGDLGVAVFHEAFTSPSAVNWKPQSAFNILDSTGDSAQSHHFSSFNLNLPTGRLAVTGQTDTASDNANGWAGLVATFTPIPLPYQPLTPPWHFLFGAPLTGRFDGEISQSQSRELILRAGPTNFSEVDVNINGREYVASQLKELLTDITVIWQDKFLFQGRVVPTQDTLDSDQHRVQVTALDYRAVLRRRNITTLTPNASGGTLVFNSQDVALIAWNLVQAVQSMNGGNYGITRGAGQTTGIIQNFTATVGDFAGDDIDTVAQLSPGNFDWGIEPYGANDLRLDIFVGTRGNARGVVLEYGGGLVDTVTRQVDPSTYANAVFVTGASNASLTDQALEAAGLAGAASGRWDLTIGTQLLTSSALISAAQYYLGVAEALQPSYTVTLHPGVWQGPGHIWLGDSVLVVINSGRLAVRDTLFVTEMDFAISPDGLETLTLTLGPIPWRLHQQIPRMLRRLRIIESQLAHR